MRTPFFSTNNGINTAIEIISYIISLEKTFIIKKSLGTYEKRENEWNFKRMAVL